MSGPAIAILISVLMAAISIGAVVFAAGKQAEKVAAVAKKAEDLATEAKALASKEQLQAVIARACEDRNRDDERIKELFISRNEMQTGIVEITASMQSVCDRLGRIEPKLDKLLERGGV